MKIDWRTGGGYVVHKVYPGTDLSSTWESRRRQEIQDLMRTWRVEHVELLDALAANVCGGWWSGAYKVAP